MHFFPLPHFFESSGTPLVAVWPSWEWEQVGLSYHYQGIRRGEWVTDSDTGPPRCEENFATGRIGQTRAASQTSLSSCRVPVIQMHRLRWRHTWPFLLGESIADSIIFLIIWDLHNWDFCLLCSSTAPREEGKRWGASAGLLKTMEAEIWLIQLLK